MSRANKAPGAGLRNRRRKAFPHSKWCIYYSWILLVAISAEQMGFVGLLYEFQNEVVDLVGIIMMVLNCKAASALIIVLAN